MGVLTKKEKDKLTTKIEVEEKIEKEVSLSWDGKNLVMRFPKDLADYFEVNKDNRFTKNVRFIVEEKNGQITKEFDVVDRTNPRRIINKNDKKKNKTKN